MILHLKESSMLSQHYKTNYKYALPYAWRFFLEIVYELNFSQNESRDTLVALMYLKEFFHKVKNKLHIYSTWT